MSLLDTNKLLIYICTYIMKEKEKSKYLIPKFEYYKGFFFEIIIKELL